MEIEIVTNLILDLVESIRFPEGFTYSETGLYTRGPEALRVEVVPRSRAKEIAWSLAALVLFRIIQGLGAGMLMPTLQTILAIHINESKIRLAFTATAVPAIIAPLAGPLAGGFLLHGPVGPGCF
jgi:MFS family permease